MRTTTDAIAWANAQAHWTPFSCLNFVYNAYYNGAQTELGKQGIALPTAKSAWNASQYKVTDGSEPPVGALMYFDGVPGDEAGDVQIYIGNHKTRRTDVGYAGTCGTVDWKWMNTNIGHPYLGWTRDILGALTFPAGDSTAGTGGATVIPNPIIKLSKEKDMVYYVQTTEASNDKRYGIVPKGWLFVVDPIGRTITRLQSSVEANVAKSSGLTIVGIAGNQVWELATSGGLKRHGW
jgi:hypothetical protein